VTRTLTEGQTARSDILDICMGSQVWQTLCRRNCCLRPNPPWTWRSQTALRDGEAMWSLLAWPISTRGEYEHVPSNSWRGVNSRSPTGSIDVIVQPRRAGKGDRGVALTTTYPTTRENSLVARSGELQLERGADCTDWLALEAWHGAGKLLTQRAQFPVIG
jgi:hypothetical protein